MSGATPSIASSRMPMDFRARRIPAILARPFTASITLWAPSGADSGKEYGSMNADIRNSAAISGTWNIDYFHGDNKIVSEWSRLADRADSHLQQRGVFSATTGANKSFDSTNASARMLLPAKTPCLARTAARLHPASGSNEVTAWFQYGSFHTQGAGVGWRHRPRRRRRQRRPQQPLWAWPSRSRHGGLPQHYPRARSRVPAPRRNHQRLKLGQPLQPHWKSRVRQLTARSPQLPAPSESSRLRALNVLGNKTSE